MWSLTLPHGAMRVRRPNVGRPLPRRVRVSRRSTRHPAPRRLLASRSVRRPVLPLETVRVPRRWRASDRASRLRRETRQASRLAGRFRSFQSSTSLETFTQHPSPRRGELLCASLLILPAPHATRPWRRTSLHRLSSSKYRELVLLPRGSDRQNSADAQVPPSLDGFLPVFHDVGKFKNVILSRAVKNRLLVLVLQCYGIQVNLYWKLSEPSEGRATLDSHKYTFLLRGVRIWRVKL